MQAFNVSKLSDLWFGSSMELKHKKLGKNNRRSMKG